MCGRRLPLLYTVSMVIASSGEQHSRPSLKNGASVAWMQRHSLACDQPVHAKRRVCRVETQRRASVRARALKHLQLRPAPRARLPLGFAPQVSVCVVMETVGGRTSHAIRIGSERPPSARVWTSHRPTEATCRLASRTRKVPHGIPRRIRARHPKRMTLPVGESSRGMK